MLLVEPLVFWDSFPFHSGRQGKRILLSSEEIPPARTPGYPNPILQADRVRKAIQEMPGATYAEVGEALGLSKNWIGDLLRISRLPKGIQRYVRAMGPLVLRSQITGMDLRRLSRITTKKSQLSFFKAILRKRGLPIAKYLK